MMKGVCFLSVRMFVLMFVVLVLVQCAQSRRKKRQRTDARRLSIMTMLTDLQDNRHVLNLFTQLRSMRLFRIGNATLQLCIPIKPGGTAILDLLSLTEQFGVELLFAPHTGAGGSRFDCWRGFHPDRFDRLLWLDPETLLFRDPVSLLPPDLKGGPSVHCVAEIYSPISARRRAALPPERQGQLSCSLAVLLLDAAALSSLAASWPPAGTLVASSESELFATAAAREGISLRSFDSNHRLNYRLAHESEIMRAGPLHADDLQAIINFAGLPEMVRCAPSPEPDQCACAYADARPLPLSHMNAMLRFWLNSPRGRSEARCEVLAGMQAAPFAPGKGWAAYASQAACVAAAAAWSDNVVSIVATPPGAPTTGTLAFQADLLSLVPQPSRRQQGGGVIICCHSRQGAATALQLTGRWQRSQGVLTVLLLGQLGEGDSAALAEELSASCAGVCVVLLGGAHESLVEWSHKGAALLAAATGMHSQQLLFVDVPPETLSRAALSTWLDRVSAGGVIAGAGWDMGEGDAARAVVGEWAACAGLAVRVTLDHLAGCAAAGAGATCLSAWYVVKTVSMA